MHYGKSIRFRPPWGQVCHVSRTRHWETGVLVMTPGHKACLGHLLVPTFFALFWFSLNVSVRHSKMLSWPPISNVFVDLRVFISLMPFCGFRTCGRVPGTDGGAYCQLPPWVPFAFVLCLVCQIVQKSDLSFRMWLGGLSIMKLCSAWQPKNKLRFSLTMMRDVLTWWIGLASFPVHCTLGDHSCVVVLVVAVEGPWLLRDLPIGDFLGLCCGQHLMEQAWVSPDTFTHPSVLPWLDLTLLPIMGKTHSWHWVQWGKLHLHSRLRGWAVMPLLTLNGCNVVSNNSRPKTICMPTEPGCGPNAKWSGLIWIMWHAWQVLMMFDDGNMCASKPSVRSCKWIRGTSCWLKGVLQQCCNNYGNSHFLKPPWPGFHQSLQPGMRILVRLSLNLRSQRRRWVKISCAACAWGLCCNIVSALSQCCFCAHFSWDHCSATFDRWKPTPWIWMDCCFCLQSERYPLAHDRENPARTVCSNVCCTHWPSRWSWVSWLPTALARFSKWMWPAPL